MSVRTYGTISYDRGYWRVQCEPHVTMRLKRVFKARASKNGIKLTANAENAFELQWFAKRYPLEVRGQDAAQFRAAAERYEERLTAVEKIVGDRGYTPPLFGLALPPRDYQAQAADLLLSSGQLLLADDLGVGKTISAICALSDRRALPALVVTLTHLPKQWQRELARFAPTLHTHVLKKGTPYDLRRGYRGRVEPFPDPKAFGSYLREQGLMLRRTRADVGRELPPLSKVTHHVDADLNALETVTDSVAELAKTILEQTGMSGQDRMRASAELDWRLRQATGIAKAPYVAEFVRLLVESGERVLLYGWHHECFARGTPVLMSDGTVKPVEDVAVGDQVMGPDSRPRRVLSLVRGRGKLFQVTPTKGEPWVCSENHILALRCSERNRRPYSTMPTSDFLRLSPRAQRAYSLYRAPAIDFGGADVVEPWLLGYWLGDGNSSLQTLCVSTADPEVVAEAAAIARRHGLGLRVNRSGSGSCAFYSFTSGPRRGEYRSNALLTVFQGLGLHQNKHIPHAYKVAPAAARRELLAGLLDSDGHVYLGNGAGSAVIMTALRRLADDIAFLCRSLGLAAYVSPVNRKTTLSPVPRDYYRVNISGDLTEIPTRIARKRAPVRRQRKDVLHTGFRVTPAGDGDFYGFEVDGDHLFLLGDFTVVHNCYSIWRDRLAEFDPGFFTGRDTQPQKDRAIKRFVGGETPVLIMSLRAGAGIDGLQGSCRTVVFGELDWSPGVHEQAIGRIHRDGQAEPVMAYFLIADSGSDPIVADVLGVKAQQVEGIRNPTGELFETVKADGNHIRRLAEDFLARRGQKERAA